MPLPPRLLRPIVSGDADARLYIEAVQRADGNTLEPDVRKAITDFVVGCKSDGIWTAIKACCILMGARTLSGALVPLVGTAPTNNNFVSGDYDRKTGLVGNASTKYLNSNRSNSADPQNDQHMAVYATTAGDGTSYYIGAAGGGISGATNIGTTAGGMFYRSQASSLSTSAGTPTGFIGLSRAASGNYDTRDGGATTNRVVSSQAPDSRNVFLYADNRGNGTTGSFFSRARIAYYSVGTSLAIATLDTRVSDLYTAIGTAVP